MENQLTSLMKQKYGMIKSSKLVFTEKDTLYTSFRKLADNIYKNGEWSPEDERAAVDTMIRNQQSLPVGQETLTWRSKNTVEPQPLTITIQELSEKEKNYFEARIDSNRSGYKAITTKYDEISGAEEAKENFIFLDPTNKTGTKHNRRYYYNAGSDVYWDGDRVDTRIYFSEGNMNRAIGYDKLQRDILKVYDSRSEELSEEGLSRIYVERLLRDLTNPKYSGQKGWSIFRKNEYGELTDEFLETLPRDESVKYWQVPPTKEQLEEGRYDNFNWRDISTAPNDPNKLNLDESPYILESADGLSRRFLYPNSIKDYRKHNRAVDFIENYIQDTYDVFLQREYEKDIEKQVRASAWQTKKNINKETQELMDHTSLNDHFGFIEVDNHVDLELFGQFEKEMNRISALLPKTQSTADLRLRKLGNYHALGIYHPLTQTIAIDFRDYGDSIGGIGIQSFVHEYGHFLDYTSEEKLLSLQEDFQSFVARYRSNITKLPSDSIVRNKADYYGTPTEVWARAFEIYVSDTGLKSIFLKSADDYKIQDAYLAFDETMRNELSTYFDQRFPELKKSIALLNNPEINVENELTEEKPKTEEEVNVVEKRDMDLLKQEQDPKRTFREFYEELNDNEREYIQLLNDFNRERLDNHFADNSGNHSHEAKLKLEEFSKNLDTARIEELKSNYTNYVSTSISKNDSMLHMDSLYKVTDEIDEERKEERESELLINKISKLSSEQKQYMELKVSNTLLSEVISNLNEGIIEEVSHKEYYESQLQDTSNISKSISNSEKKVNEYEATLTEAESSLEKLDNMLSEDEKQQVEDILAIIPYDDVQEYMEQAEQTTIELDQAKENSTGDHSLESSLSSVNEASDNRYFQIEFNESNPGIGIDRYQGEIVTPELISELQSLESLANDESKSFKFYFDEVVDGDVVKHHRMDLGDQEGINKPMYGLLREGAVSKRRAMQIRPNRVVVGGRTAQRKTTMSVDDQQIDRYFRVESNEMDQRVFPNDYSGQVVTKDLITELYKLEGRATYPESPSKFVFAEVTNGEVTDHAEIEVGRNFAENKLIYDRLSEAAVSQEKAKELENAQPIQPSSTELNETVKSNTDFNKIMQASSSEYLSDFKQALDEVFNVMEEKEEGTNQYLTRAEIDSLLDEHLTKIEKMISSYTTAAASLENATKEQKSTFLQEMLKNIKAEVTQFKENLLRTLTTKKDNVIYNVQDKTDTLRINVKNSINSRILKVNDSIRKIVEKVDQTFVLEEKELRSKIDSKTTEEQQVKETTEQSVETSESPLEEKIELPKEKEEATQTPLENEHTVETKEVDQTPTSKVDEEKKIEKSAEPADEDSIEKANSIPDNNQPDHEPTQNNYTEQIEQLSKQLNLTITDEDRKAIEGLSTEEKEGLIQELTTTISESSKSVSTEEPELEVG